MSIDRVNLAHVVSREAHGMHGYREVIETVQFGLNQMGFDATISENTIDLDRLNIVFGAQALPEPDLQALPRDTIVYNFEQMSGLEADRIRPSVRIIGERFRVWEYSEANLPTWGKVCPQADVVHVPVGWAPILRRIEKSSPQDIDALIYGLPGLLRLQTFFDLCHRGVKCVFVSGMYGAARDALISRSKLVLNINLYDHSRIFEIVRVSYLLANAKAVVADIRPETFIEPGLEGAIAFAAAKEVCAKCLELLSDENARAALEEHGPRVMEKRPIVPILRAACEKSGLL